MVGFGFETVVQDLRFALRQLRKNPGFALTAIVILALGIGASVAIFAFVDAALIKPLPYPNPTRLVDVTESLALFPREQSVLCGLSGLEADEQRRSVRWTCYTRTGYRAANALGDGACAWRAGERGVLPHARDSTHAGPGFSRRRGCGRRGAGGSAELWNVAAAVWREKPTLSARSVNPERRCTHDYRGAAERFSVCVPRTMRSSGRRLQPTRSARSGAVVTTFTASAG